MSVSSSTPAATGVARRIAARHGREPVKGRDAWLKDWHASRAVRRSDERLIRDVRQATRASIWIGPVVSAVAIYLTLEGVLRSLFDRLMLALP